ncbi:MAG: hypothetical protein ACJAQX_001781 [Polaribacter sp.]|jgi:hypothetical protein|uniref:hypothetical protein n=1 Tax=Polaribacter sp. TaxID=1920175 RepID=UPI003ACCBEE4
MEENRNTAELDAFAKKYVKEIHTESPSKDFTASLMSKIVVEHQKSVFRMKTLISKKGWFVIFVLVLALILIPFESSEKSFIDFSELDFSFFSKIQIPNLSISNTVLYAICFFGLSFAAQVIFLKNYFNKRFE